MIPMIIFRAAQAPEATLVWGVFVSIVICGLITALHLQHPFFHLAGDRAQGITQNHHRLGDNRLYGHPGKLSMAIPLQ